MMLFRLPCNCEICLAERKIDRSFEAKIIRIGRKYGIPNERMLRPKIGFWDDKKGEIYYVRLPYGID